MDAPEGETWDSASPPDFFSLTHFVVKRAFHADCTILLWVEDQDCFSVLGCLCLALLILRMPKGRS